MRVSQEQDRSQKAMSSLDGNLGPAESERLTGALTLSTVARRLPVYGREVPRGDARYPR
jgi:hypothetical protein